MLFLSLFLSIFQKICENTMILIQLVSKSMKTLYFLIFSMNVYHNDAQKVRFEALRPWLHKSTK